MKRIVIAVALALVCVGLVKAEEVELKWETEPVEWQVMHNMLMIRIMMEDEEEYYNFVKNTECISDVDVFVKMYTDVYAEEIREQARVLHTSLLGMTEEQVVAWYKSGLHESLRKVKYGTCPAYFGIELGW